jgi:hypothetical protein
MAPRFNVQAFLSEMRNEQREDAESARQSHATLTTKVDEGFKAIAAVASAHELAEAKQFAEVDKRLSTVENTRRTMRWLGATVLVSLCGAVVDFLFVHLPKLLAAGKP